MRSTTLKNNLFTPVLSYFFYPVGVRKIWQNNTGLVTKLLYTLLGLPIFLLLFSFLGVVLFAAFLPELDLSVGNRLDRTVFNKAGNYSATFLKTGRETQGKYELIRVELEPNGGNDWHYHKTFTEHFQVEAGRVLIGLEGEEKRLEKGEKATAFRHQMHFFKNPSAAVAVLAVRVEPARGLEKTIRIAYGLANDGLFSQSGLPENPWHLALLLGYSESYLAGMPGFVQEPLVKSLAKIAQWKGEAQALEKYFQ